MGRIGLPGSSKAVADAETTRTEEQNSRNSPELQTEHIPPELAQYPAPFAALVPTLLKIPNIHTHWLDK